MLCAVCLQAPLNVGAVDLPIVPVEESQAETTTTVSETPAATHKPAEQETPVIPEAPATSKAAETTRASASDGYIRALAENFYGIEDCIMFKAVGLDIDGADEEQILLDCEKQIREGI